MTGRRLPDLRWTTFRGIARGKDESWKGSWRMWRFERAHGDVVCQGGHESATMERRSAAEQKSGIGGRMVRTKETNVAYQGEQQETEGTAEDGQSLTGPKREQGLEQDLLVVSMLLENALLGSAYCSRICVGLSEKAGQANASEKEPPGICIADAWLAEPEWAGESSEAKAETAAGSREPEE